MTFNVKVEQECDKVKEDKRGQTCSTHGKDLKCNKIIARKLKGRHHR
jgi:hypothetical protein